MRHGRLRLRVALLGLACGACGGGPPAPDRGPAAAGPVLGVTLVLDAEHGQATYDRQISFCRESGISAVRIEGDLKAPGAVPAIVGPARTLLDRFDTVLLGLDPVYARQYGLSAEGALRKDVEALAAQLDGARARVIVAVGGGRAWEEAGTAAMIRRTLAPLRGRERVVAWEVEVPVGPEGPPGGGAGSNAPDTPGWARPWTVFADALDAAAAAPEIDAVAVRYFPNWEAAHGRRPAPLAAYVDSLRGILRRVTSRGKPVLVSEFGLADRDQRFAARAEVIAAVARLAREEKALGAFYYSLLGPDFGIYDADGWRVKWKEVTDIR